MESLVQDLSSVFVITGLEAYLGLSALSKAQVELLTRFRCSQWQQEVALPPLPLPLATSPVKRRSARVRTAPASYTPFFSQRRHALFHVWLHPQEKGFGFRGESWPSRHRT